MEELQKSLQDFGVATEAFQTSLGATRLPCGHHSSLNAEFISFRSSVITCLENLQPSWKAFQNAGERDER
ncbi:unnamed protein product [Leptosia nina]|uniref:Uncharacterized protein n=1 Tax=Leptosia nina TaxID=320188 RepID=A0AAV1JKY3_9NEOP